MPAVNNNTAVYIGCLNKRYGPLVINCASKCGMGKIRILLMRITHNDHATSTIANVERIRPIIFKLNG